MSGRRDGITQYDTSSGLETPALHPTTLMGLVTMIISGLAQMSPKDFMPERFIGIKYAGAIPPQRLTVFPALTVFALYCAAGIQIYEGNRVRGHMCSMLLSFGCAAFSAACSRISMLYWMWFAVYAGYGAFYDGRRLALYSDGAPTYRWGDLSGMYRMSRELKAARRAEHDQAIALRQRQYEAALAAKETAAA
jgi:hypothetical protein